MSPRPDSAKLVRSTTSGLGPRRASLSTASTDRNISVPPRDAHTSVRPLAAIQHWGKVASAAIHVDLPDEAATAAAKLREIAERYSHMMSRGDRITALALINRLTTGLKHRTQDFTEICEARTQTYLAVSAFRDLQVAFRCLADRTYSTADHKVAAGFRHLSTIARSETNPTIRMALAFASLEHALRLELSSEKVAMGLIRELLPSFVQDLPPTLQHGLSSLLLGLLGTFRTKALHGMSAISTDTADTLSRILDHLHVFARYPEERGTLRQAATPGEQPLFARVTKRLPPLPRISGQRHAKRAFGISNVRRGAELMARSLDIESSQIPPDLRSEIHAIVKLSHKLFAELAASRRTPRSSGVPPSTLAGRSLARFQSVEALVDQALSELGVAQDQRPRLTREQLAMLFAQPEFCRQAGLTNDDGRDASMLLQSLFMLYRNLPIHDGRFDLTPSYDAASKLAEFVASTTIGEFLRLRGSAQTKPPPFQLDSLSIHPLLLHSCWQPLVDGDYGQVYLKSLGTACAAERNWTYRVDPSAFAQGYADHAPRELLEYSPGLFRRVILPKVGDAREYAHLRLAFDTALLGYFCLDYPSLTQVNNRPDKGPV